MVDIAYTLRLIETANTAQLGDTEKTAWLMAFGLLLVVATAGNSFVSWFIISRRRLVKAYSCFMLGLTTADFAMLYMECVFNIIYIIEGHWKYGRVYCVIDNFLSELTTAACIFILTATSYDRYSAIVKPLAHRATRKSAVCTVLGCWMVATFFALPALYYSDEYSMTSTGLDNGMDEDKEQTKCELVWPEQDAILNNKAYRIVVFVVTYLLPSVLMGYWNVRIGWVLTKSTEPFKQQEGGGRQLAQIQSLKQKRRHLAWGLWTIVIIFCCCWLPYQTYMMYQTFAAELNIHTKRVCLIVYWLAVSNAAANPLLFYKLDRQYQDYVDTLFKHCACSHRQEVTPVSQTQSDLKTCEA